MRLKLVVIALLGCMLSANAKHNLPEQGKHVDIDMPGALSYCRQGTLDNIEGIWDYADEGFSCLIQKHDNRMYRMMVLEADDARLQPGTVVGYLFPTPDAKIFDLYLYTKVKNDMPCSAKQCIATLTADGEGLALKCKKFRFTPNPVALLPWMWRLMWVNIDNPIEKMPRGLTKVAPGYDGNGSSRRHTIYL